ncbi:acyl-CoA thioesterase [Salipiger marinus]|uniref:Acyl-CoA thioesterase n=1 Tax=Salipiger marinus TaxID=555512 RepID=A0A1G8RPM3_9RHOB|nr:acyl-CoA thioesterase [Salipiger marinus]
MKDTATLTPQQLAEACAQAMWNADSASQRLGMVLTRIAPGQAVLTMTLTERMTNGHGNAHGGYLFTLADSAFAFACNTYNVMTVAQHCAVTYITPGALGDRLVATAREVSRTGRSGIYDVTVTREDGTVIAEFRGHSRALNRPLLPDTGAEA